MSEQYVRRTPRSRQAFEKAKKVFPAGVSYKIRFIEPYPFCVTNAQGSKLFDIDGNVYTDYWCAHFALILGHRHPEVVKAVKEQVEKDFHYGVTHELEAELAEQIVRMVPSAELIRFSGSGTEANMYAVRLARTYTGRNGIGKFEGNWHGAYDPLHVAMKPPFEEPASGGLTPGSLADTVVLPFNDLDGVRKRMQGKQLACVLVEPVMGAGGMIPADREFLKGLAELCGERDTLLIFDEVITGFRLSSGGAQQLYGIKPDLTILGKIAGGGLPIGAITGRADVMERMDHTKFRGSEYSFHGGTHTGNPVSMAAGLATLRILEDESIYRKIGRMGEKMRAGLTEIMTRAGLEFQTTGVGSIFGCHFTKIPVKDVLAASTGDKELSKKLMYFLLDRGIFCLTPELVHCAISTAHTDADIEEFLAAAETFARQAGK
jgi:glutamate-1-semialdehyde 2,1-aminomutase